MPHMARACLVSSRGDTSMPAAVFSTLICSGQVKQSSPLGPFIVTVWPATVAVTPDGIGDRLLANARHGRPYLLLRACAAPPQNTLQRISPPTFSSRARVSDITPLGVDRMATPRPLATVARSRTAL